MNNAKLLIGSLSLILFSLFSCAPSAEQKDLFEGILTYKIQFNPISGDSNYLAFQKQKYGGALKMTISKDGNFRRDYLSSGARGFDFVIFNVASNKLFGKWRTMDTVYSFDSGTNSLTLLSDTVVSGERIHGENCLGYRILANEPQLGQHASFTYYYPQGKEYINPALYAKAKDGFYDMVIARMQSPYYKLIMEMDGKLGKFAVTYEVEKIEKTILNPDVFALPAGVPVVEK
jgi:hypothetical protein